MTNNLFEYLSSQVDGLNTLKINASFLIGLVLTAYAAIFVNIITLDFEQRVKCLNYIVLYPSLCFLITSLALLSKIILPSTINCYMADEVAKYIKDNKTPEEPTEF